jgi:phage anti-repressor protein/DNA-binding XRE family transcriptional regulator
MNYKLLFADIFDAILNRGETVATFAKENKINQKTLSDWFKGSKPRRTQSVKDFFTAINVLEIRLFPYANVATVAGRIEYLRLDRRLTTLELSSLVGCHPNTITDWERGRIMPNHKLNVLAKSLSTTPSYIMYGTEKTESPRNGLIDFPPQPTVQISIEEVEPVVENETPMPAIIKQNIGNEEVNAVNARDLHKKLQSKQDFSTWIKARIQKYGFVEGVDYLLHKIMEQLPSGAKTKHEYIISIRMAQELSMLEDNEVGKAARLYFIECEKLAKGEAPKVEPKQESSLIENIKKAGEVISATMSVLNLLGIEGNQAKLGANKVAAKATGFNLLEEIGETNIVSPVQERYYTPTDLGKDYDLSGQGFNKLLADQGFQFKDGEKWTPTEKDKSFSVLVDTDKANSTGTIQQLFWYKSIKDVIEL